MADIVLTAVGIFAIGVVVGIIAMVTHGVNRERRRFEKLRRYREEQGIWHDPDASGYFLPDEAPDGVSLAARRFNGLYVRRAADRYDPALAARV